MTKKILIVTTNSRGDENIKETGVYLEEFAIPYIVFDKTGYSIDTASLKGGLSPVDENSMSCSNPMEWDYCIKVLRETKKLSDIDFSMYDVLYFPGGHGPLFDLAKSDEIKNLVEYFYSKGKIIAAICHGVCALLEARDKNGVSILKNKNVTSFTDKEEYIIKLNEFVPFSIEKRLKELEADYIEEKPFKEHVEVNGNIITGQNQKSALLLAERIVEKLGQD